ncbi:hypothetical protein K466DRAFT_665034 [Polyporus arcularius HHB13444]|uniref:Uncharacterized protein n=1 Tax=Polyporus arcularius HHB13444 TaxID=1314778 RepID=A0A5C3PFH0_9APHY|nr:hypothetical protein K466DRAFT_665034 [Polyporus arcularius HHB13444]
MPACLNTAILSEYIRIAERASPRNGSMDAYNIVVFAKSTPSFPVHKDHSDVSNIFSVPQPANPAHFIGGCSVVHLHAVSPDFIKLDDGALRTRLVSVMYSYSYFKRDDSNTRLSVLLALVRMGEKHESDAIEPVWRPFSPRTLACCSPSGLVRLGKRYECDHIINAADDHLDGLDAIFPSFLGERG